MNDFENEVAPGLPEHLPRGEHIVWQGSPDWRALALKALHVRKVAIYFALLAIWRAAESLYGGATALDALTGAAWIVLLGLAGCAILAGLAWLIARSTLYTITNARVVLRYGIALPMSVNVPYTIIDAASYKGHADGTSDLPLALAPSQRMGYLLTWPHVRPWKFSPVQPMLRAIPDGQRVARLLSDALAASQGAAAAASRNVSAESPRTAQPRLTVAA